MKLVRDGIPEIIRAKGQTPILRDASAQEIGALLVAKLLEEVAELLAEPSSSIGQMEEVADVLEVLHAMAEWYGFPWDDVEQLRLEKRQARGGFGTWIVWEGNAE